jgi:glycosyltransferase involved in cell wall biosynthesis
MDKISIITVSYNAEKTIRATIESVLTQSYQDIEYILIDGDSDDGTYEIICQYDDAFSCKGIRYFHISEPDNGIYDAMNKALDYCTGGWVNYMNANDTFFSPETLSDVFSDSYEGYDCVYGDTYNVKEGYRYYKKSYPIECICYKGAFVHQALFVRMSQMKQYRFNTKYSISADYDLFVRLYKNDCVFKQVNIPIAVYSLDGVSQTQTKQVRQQWKQIQIENGIYNTMMFRRLVYEKMVFKMRDFFLIRKVYVMWCNRNKKAGE